MRDMRLRLLPYFQNIFALIAPPSYILSLSKYCPNLNLHCPICQSHEIALLPGWWNGLQSHLWVPDDAFAKAHCARTPYSILDLGKLK